MSSIRTALFEWDATRLLVVSLAGVAVYLARRVTDGTASGLLLALLLAALFAGVATYVKNRISE